MNTLEKVQKNLPHFSKSERKVAEVILASPQTAIHSSIATLAKMADVSEPTVNRFCRRLDTKGFPDFKLHLAQSLANGTPYVSRHVEEDDTPESYTTKIFESSIFSGYSTPEHRYHGHQQGGRHTDSSEKDLFLRSWRLGLSSTRCPEQVLSL